MTGWAVDRRRLIEAYATVQQATNERVERGLLRIARERMGREPSCATCDETSKHCCRMLVVISLLDAVPIAARVLARNDEDLLARLREQADRQRTITANEWWDRQEACAFLQDERCGVYDIRPLPCRAHHAWSPPRCCSRWNQERLIATEPGFEVNLYVLTQGQELLRSLFETTIEDPPFIDTLPGAVLYAIDALQSKTLHRCARRLIEAQTDMEMVERRAVNNRAPGNSVDADAKTV